MSQDVTAGMRQGLSSPFSLLQPNPSTQPTPPWCVYVCVSPAKAKLKAFATCIHIQLKAPLCCRGGTAAETPCCLFPSVVAEKVAARLPSEPPPPAHTHKHTPHHSATTPTHTHTNTYSHQTQKENSEHNTSQNPIKKCLHERQGPCFTVPLSLWHNKAQLRER